MNLKLGIRVWYITSNVIMQTLASSCNFNADAILTKNVALQNHRFWSAKTDDVTDCARTCVKRKQCVSFNFDTNTQRCELNNAVKHESNSFRTGTSLVYSRISDWPSQIDPNCFARPCGEDEVCMPGYLTGNSDCSYSCFNLIPPSTPTTTTPTTMPAPTTTRATTTTITTPAPTTTTTPAPTTTTTPVPTTTRTTTATTTTTTPAPTTTTTTPAPTTTRTTTATTTTTTTTTTPALATTTPAPTLDIRLVDGITSNEGRLEMLHSTDAMWRSVQLETSKWSWKVTQVVCRQLGFNHGGSYHKVDNPFPRSSYKSYKLEDISCSGSEATIFDCYVKNYKKENGVDKDIGITCFTDRVNKTGFENIRIIDDAGNTNSQSGQIQISYSNQWTMVCGEIKGSAKDVFCNTVSGGTWESAGDNSESITDTPMWTTDIECFDATTPHPFFCLNLGWRLGNCDQYATVSCRDI